MVTKGSIGPALTVVSLAEDSNKGSLSLSGPREVSAHVEESHRKPALSFDRCAAPAELPINMVPVTEGRCVMSVECRRVRRMISKEVVFQCRGNSHICYILQTIPRSRLESSSTGSSFPAEYSTPMLQNVWKWQTRGAFLSYLWHALADIIPSYKRLMQMIGAALWVKTHYAAWQQVACFG